MLLVGGALPHPPPFINLRKDQGKVLHESIQYLIAYIDCEIVVQGRVQIVPPNQAHSLSIITGKLVHLVER